MAPPVLVTGGTGTLGRLVVSRLRDNGRSVRVLSRRPHDSANDLEFVTGDLDSGDGLDAAVVAGVETIVHCAGSAKGDEVKARHLVRAAARAGAPHVVNISVVGAERVPVESRVDHAMFGYFAAKRAAENVIAESGLPWTTLRATQFYDSILMVVRQLAKLPVMPVPSGVRFQPVDGGEVATRLVELSLGPPSGLVPDMAGPRAYELAELVRIYLRAARRRRLLMPVRLPGKSARAIQAGANLAPDRAVGQRTWEDFLTDRLGPDVRSA